MIFLFRNSLQNLRNILFSFPSNLSHLCLSFHASPYLRVFFGRSRCFKCCVYPFAPGDFAEKRVLKLVEWFSGHCRAIKS